MDQHEIVKIVYEVVTRLLQEQGMQHNDVIPDITQEDISKWDFVHGAKQPEFDALKSRTPARLAVSHTGTRYPTHTRLRFLADHAAAKDAVDSEIPEDFAKQYNLSIFQSLCASREEYITRPDLGRQLSPQNIEGIRALCPGPADVCLFLADGLSAKAITANGMDTLLTAKAGLEAAGLSVTVPFVIRYGRVGVLDVVSEALHTPVTCVLIGERPGLGVADSMSAYAAYGATVGMSESRRTVISNIHGKGTPAVEAGAWLTDLLKEMCTTKLSGVELRGAQNREAAR
jgi:ethanolamine ammonia-lyase small subunit